MRPFRKRDATEFIALLIVTDAVNSGYLDAGATVHPNV